MRRCRSFCLAMAVLLACCAAARAAPPATAPAVPGGAWDTQLSDRLADLRIADGRVQVQTPDGPIWVDGEAFLGEIERRQQRRQPGVDGRSRLYRVLDITSPLGVLWVAIGFLGQLLFTGRMIVQWLVSERQRRSVVPPIFWWMSLTGASMLLAYFVWRQDIVGIFGQATGWLIYARNLWLLHRRAPA